MTQIAADYQAARKVTPINLVSEMIKRWQASRLGRGYREGFTYIVGQLSRDFCMAWLSNCFFRRREWIFFHGLYRLVF